MAEWLRRASQVHKMYCLLSEDYGSGPRSAPTWGASASIPVILVAKLSNEMM